MISGATYKNGIAIASNGAPYVNSLATTALVPAGTTQCKGSDVPGAKSVTSDGAINVRFR